jgi:hypothetical protein
MKILKSMPILAAGLLAAMLTSCSTSHPSDQVTMTGTMVCGKCKLHQTAECQNVLQVSDQNGNTTNYFLTQNKVSKDFHNNICTNDGEKATVTGTVEEKDGQEQLTASNIAAQ